MKEYPKNKQGGGNQAIDPILHQFLHHIGLHLEEPLLVLAVGKIVYMQSLADKIKRTLQMLSRV